EAYPPRSPHLSGCSSHHRNLRQLQVRVARTGTHVHGRVRGWRTQDQGGSHCGRSRALRGDVRQGVLVRQEVLLLQTQRDAGRLPLEQSIALRSTLPLTQLLFHSLPAPRIKIDACHSANHFSPMTGLIPAASGSPPVCMCNLRLPSSLFLPPPSLLRP
ncbi:hypothetical protein PMAYCL1PPCAC_31391, partial [Pristionchus mayeri]